ncbi:30S ribosomal protein S6--L-glutamate ligase [Kordiimonas sp. SCSIO 12610]|uniref:30S ribosomal protein S6--L-glutamate ligase n=1 Tax=Kordiimonas sp. SCSIO 12610 TaxID=2829597 RepID=UPI00210AC340|nr:30S ribosomal protein S6--L-glutamate ligase [Kordiimonas sp. SCSIO 12610]UTW56383.1 30S ribosomal protein S6--L-glutamate ligase [Kordiimonas sp. SCSIO 12610]
MAEYKDSGVVGIDVGWEEWVALKQLGLPALKAKVDTGARTSALHAFTIQPFGSEDNPKVRFGIHPIPDRPDFEVYCSASVVDRREVTSSNGQVELRYVIETPITIGGKTWPVQMTLTNRENMAFKMLLGRQAMEEDVAGEVVSVRPDAANLQGELSYDLYKTLKKAKPISRPLHIAILTREPNNYSSQRMKEAAEARGHTVALVDTKRCYLNIQSHAPEVHYDGAPLPAFDAVIPRIGASLTFYGMAVMRQFEAMGAYCVNTAAAIGASRDKLQAHQLLALHRIPMPTTAFANLPKDTDSLIELVGGAPLVVKLLQSTQGRGVVLGETKKAAEAVIGAFQGLDANFLVQEFVKEAAGEDLRCFVIGKRVVASMIRKGEEGEYRSNLHRGGAAKAVRITKAEREVAVKAAKVMGLRVAGVDILRTNDGPAVLEVNSSPGLEGIEKASKKNVADLIVDHIENNVRPVVGKLTTSRRKKP